MTTGSEDFDFLDQTERDKAADKARQSALAAPKRKPRTTKQEVIRAYVNTAVKKECDDLAAMGPDSGRNDRLNEAAFNLGTLVGTRYLSRSEAEHSLELAARSCAMHLDTKDGGMRQVRKTIKSGLDAGEKKPRDMSDVGVVVDGKTKAGKTAPEPGSGKRQRPNAEVPNSTAASTNGKRPIEADDASSDRQIRMLSAASIETRVPMWVWESEGAGRLQLGTLTMFAGRPAAGKSTAVRWFAARISRGELPGIWHGYPMKVAVMMLEEQADAIVVPGLQAAGADLRNVVLPTPFKNDIEDVFLSIRDEELLTEELIENECRALFVDPVMQTFDKGVDIYRNNDVRAYLQPYVRIAKAINGIVVCVTHLRKGQVKDVLDNINGSSAFGELPRSVFGFAPIGDGTNVLEQVKNSAGPMGLKLEYRLPISYVNTSDGQVINLPNFQIIGPTETSIADIGGESPDQDITTATADVEWLRQYLLIEQPAPSMNVKNDAQKHAGISESRLHRARRKLKVRIVNRPAPSAPHQTAWQLPDYTGS